MEGLCRSTGQEGAVKGVNEKSPLLRKMGVCFARNDPFLSGRKERAWKKGKKAYCIGGKLSLVNCFSSHTSVAFYRARRTNAQRRGGKNLSKQWAAHEPNGIFTKEMVLLYFRRKGSMKGEQKEKEVKEKRKKKGERRRPSPKIKEVSPDADGLGVREGKVINCDVPSSRKKSEDQRKKEKKKGQRGQVYSGRLVMGQSWYHQ